ncbi:MAG: alpha/beta fold hydrolase [Flavobacteriaceae bacterium]|nr:alpha/beta fold hydrolase [Flavobacteriaceae bacterium]
MKTISNHVIPGPNGRPIILDIFMPVEAKDAPLVIFCHGYKGFKDWGAWNIMSQSFAGKGVAIIKFNFSFNGGTVEQPIDFPDLKAFSQNNYSKELDDLHTVLNWIEVSDMISSSIDRSDITVMGHSRGGGIAALAANTDQRIKKLITLAGVSDFEARFNIGSEEFETWKREGVKYVLNGRTKQQMPHLFQFYKDFEANANRLNIEKALRSLQIPHLIIHGNADTSVSVEEAHNMYEWNPDAELFIIEGANHVFGVSHPWNQNNLTDAMNAAVSRIVDFISTQENE